MKTNFKNYDFILEHILKNVNPKMFLFFFYFFLKIICSLYWAEMSSEPMAEFSKIERMCSLLYSLQFVSPIFTKK